MSDLVITSRPLLTGLLTEMEEFIVFKREQVRRALWLLPQIAPRMTPEEFLRVAREVDAFSSLNYSKRKRIRATDVERHLYSKGLRVPVTTSLIVHQGDETPSSNLTSLITRRPLETG
jgi:hypothetical protein